MTVRFEKTKKGEVAIMPRREYEALVTRLNETEENAGTARIVARARKEIAAGEAVIPAEFANRILKGENPIKVIRQWRDVTQMHLAFKTDLGQGYLSDLESGRRKGTVAALKLIARELNVPLDLLT